tara:strand:- start:17 stop:172 length:156 start_codon:yes stop_codon:yes gene_type:complete
MPFVVRKIKGKFKLYNLQKKKYVSVNYKSKESATRAGKNFMKYRGEKPKVG